MFMGYLGSALVARYLALVARFWGHPVPKGSLWDKDIVASGTQRSTENKEEI